MDQRSLVTRPHNRSPPTPCPSPNFGRSFISVADRPNAPQSLGLVGFWQGKRTFNRRADRPQAALEPVPQRLSGQRTPPLLAHCEGRSRYHIVTTWRIEAMLASGRLRPSALSYRRPRTGHSTAFARLSTPAARSSRYPSRPGFPQSARLGLVWEKSRMFAFERLGAAMCRSHRYRRAEYRVLNLVVF